MIKDIRSGTYSSTPTSLTPVGSTLFFVANDGTNGSELWKTSGTASSTVMIKDIRSGSKGAYPRYLTNVGGTLFFTAYDDTNGYELWKSDGTATGTVLVKDIRSGNTSSAPRNLVAIGNTLYFRAYTDANGYELWKSDGTAAGTVLVKDVNAGTTGSYPNYPDQRKWQAILSGKRWKQWCRAMDQRWYFRWHSLGQRHQRWLIGIVSRLPSSHQWQAVLYCLQCQQRLRTLD